VCEIQRERHRERYRERERYSERERHRDRDRETQRHRDRERPVGVFSLTMASRAFLAAELCTRAAAIPAPHKDFSDLYEKMSGKGSKC
jgi:hypothetical protein